MAPLTVVGCQIFSIKCQTIGCYYVHNHIIQCTSQPFRNNINLQNRPISSPFDWIFSCPIGPYTLMQNLYIKPLYLLTHTVEPGYILMKSYYSKIKNKRWKCKTVSPSTGPSVMCCSALTNSNVPSLLLSEPMPPARFWQGLTLILGPGFVKCEDIICVSSF